MNTEIFGRSAVGSSFTAAELFVGEAEPQYCKNGSVRHHASRFHVIFIELHSGFDNLFKVYVVDKRNCCVADTEDVRKVLERISEVMRYKEIALDFKLLFSRIFVELCCHGEECVDVGVLDGR